MGAGEWGEKVKREESERYVLFLASVAICGRANAMGEIRRAGGWTLVSSCSELRALLCCGDHVMDACEDASFVDYNKLSGSRRATFRTVSPIRNVQRPVVHARTVVDDGYNRHFRLGRGCPTKARVKKVNLNLPIVLDDPACLRIQSPNRRRTSSLSAIPFAPSRSSSMRSFSGDGHGVESEVDRCAMELFGSIPPHSQTSFIVDYVP